MPRGAVKRHWATHLSVVNMYAITSFEELMATATKHETTTATKERDVLYPNLTHLLQQHIYTLVHRIMYIQSNITLHKFSNLTLGHCTERLIITFGRAAVLLS